MLDWQKLGSAVLRGSPGMLEASLGKAMVVQCNMGLDAMTDDGKEILKNRVTGHHEEIAPA